MKPLRRNLRLLWLGTLAELRNPGLRLLGAIGLVGTAVYAWNQGSLAGSASVVLAAWLGRAYGIAACLWFSYAAIRDQNERTGAALRSKPVDGASWVLLLWLSGLAVWLTLLALPFLGAALAQLPQAGMVSLAAHGFAFLRAALVVTIVATLGFALSRLLRSPLGGVLIMFGWFCAMGGVDLIPAFLRPDYSRNVLHFVTASLAVLILAAFLVERWRRGELRRPYLPIAAVLALALATACAAAHAYQSTPNLHAEGHSLWDWIAEQHPVERERVPGFWLPDGRGGWVRTSDHPGKILVVYLFAADDLDAARTLPGLDAIAAQYRDRGVQPIGVCLAPDPGDGFALARVGGYHFPIGVDPATTRTAAPPESAVALAYYAQVLPMLVVTDRRHRYRDVLVTEPYYEQSYLQTLVERRLAAEPE